MRGGNTGWLCGELQVRMSLQTKDAIYTLSAMTSGIRRNWIEALRKTVRPTSAPDVTKYVLGWTGTLVGDDVVVSLSGFCVLA